MMDCHEFNKLIISLACDTLADAALRKDALAHAAACTQCGTRLARQHNIADGLAALAVQESSIQAPAHLGVALQAAFAREMKLAPEAAGSRLADWLNWRWVTVAAILVLGVMATVVLLRRSSDSSQFMQTTVNVPRKEEAVERKESAPLRTAQSQTIAQAALVRRRVMPRVPRNLKAARRVSEEYGELLSLTPLARNETEEFQQVVRMQIPRATLRLWGLPLNEESNSEQVSAEVLFGEDGLARAIRLRH